MQKEQIETTNINHAGIKKHFNRWKLTPERAVIELIANGFDAKATEVRISTSEEFLGTTSVQIIDNGLGIDPDKKLEHFSCFNDSKKVGDDDTQGAHGRGRLAFHLLCANADWYSRCGFKDTKISISSDDLQHYSMLSLLPEQQKHSVVTNGRGTCVELTNFTANLPDDETLLCILQNEFGWRLALNDKLKLYLNNTEVSVPINESRSESIDIDEIPFTVNFFRWETKPGTENSKNYFVNSDGRVTYSENNSFNRKSQFYLSVYIQSPWVDRFDKNGGSLSFDELHVPLATPSSPIFKSLKTKIFNISRDIYTGFLRQQVESQLDRYEQQGYFPTYKNLSQHDAEWRHTNVRTVIKEIWLVEPSIFNNLGAKQAKVMISLLDKLLVSNENDSLLEVLESVVELDEHRLHQLAEQLNKTTLENIVSTIEILQRRETVVRKLEELMINNYKDVLETPHLQGIIEANTWLFGEQYSMIGAEEDDFQKTAHNLRKHIKEIDVLAEDDFEQQDLDDGLTIEGVRRQVDLFLARKTKQFDSFGKPYFKCTIIEIKKPSVSLNTKHLRQLEDYAGIIARHPGFSVPNMRFELILVGRKVSNDDMGIPRALKSCEVHNEPGMVFKEERIKGYVKTWSSIKSEFELTNSYLLENLKTRRDTFEHMGSSELVEDLQQVC